MMAELVVVLVLGSLPCGSFPGGEAATHRLEVEVAPLGSTTPGGIAGDPQGTCCDAIGFCSEVTASECASMGGIFNSSATDCAAVCCGCFSNSDCSDGDPCTRDLCLHEGEFFCGCVSIPVDSTVWCCNPWNGAWTPVNDGDVCTTDVCNTTTGNVTHIPTAANGTPCEDEGDPCTVDQCQSGACTHIPPTSDADSDSVPDCYDQCPGKDDTRDENDNGTPDCVEPPVPTTTEWGLVAMALLLLVAGKLCFGHRTSNSTT